MNHLTPNGCRATRRKGPRGFALGALASALATSVLATQAGAATPPADFSLDFNTRAPGKAADISMHIFYRDPENPDDSQSRPPALTRVMIRAPRGTVFDGSAVPACEATDVELRLLGKSACPAESVVGDGFGSVMTTIGPPTDPYVLDATLINAGDAIIEMFSFPGTTITPAVDPARFEAPNKMVLEPPVVPGITEREFDFTYYGSPEAAKTPFITTPPRCPPSGMWRSKLSYTVTTGDTYSVSSTTPCRRPRSRTR
jgi:hypothetical protein